MAQIQLRGLQGLKGLNSRLLSAYRDSLYDLGLINVHTPVGVVHNYMDNLAKQDEFRTKYIPLLTLLALEGQIPMDLLNTTDVNQMEYLALAVDILKEFDNKYSPYVVDYIDGAGKPHYVVDYTDNGGRPHYKVDPNKGLGNELTYLKYQQMTPEGKKALLDSEYKIPSQISKENKESSNAITKWGDYILYLFPQFRGLDALQLAILTSGSVKENAENFNKLIKKIKESKDSEEIKKEKMKDLLLETLKYNPVEKAEESLREGSPLNPVREGFNLAANIKELYSTKLNQAILDKIMDEDLKRRRAALGNLEDEKLKNLSNLSDTQIDNMFNTSIHLEDGYGNELLKVFFNRGDSSIEGFNSDEKRKYLAMQLALQEKMDPLSAQEFLINYAKDYISDHTSKKAYVKKLADDILLSAASYSADKVNGLVGLAKMFNQNKYSVYIDDQGNAYNLKDVSFDKNGAFTNDEDGNRVNLHKELMTSSLLFALGKGTDGSDKHWFLNNKFWDNVEQWGTTNENMLKIYSKAGYSPNKVIYKAGDEADIIYETAKMTSFGLADGIVTAGLSMLSGGAGAIGKLANTGSRLAKVAGGAAAFIENVGRWGGPALSTAGIANAYARGTYQENVFNNLSKLELASYDHANADFIDKYKSNKEGFKDLIDAETKKEYLKLKAEYDRLLRASGLTVSKEEYEAQKQALLEQAADTVSAKHIDNSIKNIQSSDGYYDAINLATADATLGALIAGVTDAIKYLPVNYFGHRAFLFKNRSKMISDALRSILERVKDAGKLLVYEPKIFLQNAGRKAKEFGKFAGKLAFGGAWTNYTDEWHVAGGKRLNDDKFSAYLNGMYDNEAVNNTYSLGDAITSYILGSKERIPQLDALWAGLVGALGSVFSFAPNFEGMGRLAFDKKAREEFKRNWNLLRQGAVDSNGNVDIDAADLMSGGERRRARGDAFMLLVNTFINNGVLQEYEAKKLAEADVMQNIESVNRMLNEYEDFESVEDALALDLAEMDASNEQDKKTLEFLKALKSIHQLNSIAAEENAESTVYDRLFAKSSAVLKARKGWDDIQKIASDSYTEEEKELYLAEYYNKNKNITRNEQNDALALQELKENAQMLVNTSLVYDEVSKEIDEIDAKVREESGNKSILNPKLREKLILRKALDKFINDEINETEQIATGRQITDFEEKEIPIDVFGSQDAVNAYVKGNEIAIRDIEKQEKSNEEELNKNKEEYVNKLKKEFNITEDINPDTYLIPLEEEAKLPQEVADEVNELKKKYDSSKLLKTYLEESRKILQEKNDKLQKASEGYKSREEILTANEIISLDPEARAMMLDPRNINNYSLEQKVEIQKAIKKINSLFSTFSSASDGSPLTIRQQRDLRTGLDKLLDLANLMKHKRANEKAFEMMSSNIEAAQYQLEAQKYANGMLNAYSLSEQYVTNIDRLLKNIKDATIKDQGKHLHEGDIQHINRLARESIKRNLSVLHPNLLLYAKDNIDRFPSIKEYEDLLDSAIEWADFTTNVQRSIDNNPNLKPEERKLFKNDIDRLLKQNNTYDKLDAIEVIKEVINSERELFRNAKNALDKGTHAFMSKAFESVLNDILKTDLLKGITNETTSEELKKREVEQLKKRNTFSQLIKSAESLPLITKDEKGNQQVGNYKVNTVTYANGNLKRATLNHEGDPSTMWKVSGEKLKELGITPELILGNKSNWENNPLLYEKLLNSIPKGEIAIESISIDGNGNTMVNLAPNATTLTIEGLTVLDQEASNKLFNYLTDGIKPEDFVIKKEEKKKEERSKEKLPQEGEIEDDKDEGNELMKDENEEGDEVMEDNLEGDEAMYDNPDELVSNEEVDAALQGVGVTYLESPSVEKQGETLEGDKNIEIDDLPKDTTDNGNNLPPNDATNMLGNPFYLYDVDSLKDSGFRKLVRRKILRRNSPYEKAMMWMDKNGVKLQEIIDNELHRIIQHNPKLHFLKFKMLNHNEFDDYLLSDLCPLCVEYTLKVSDIHDSSRGGVFTANGKLYLMVGFAGFDTKSRALGDAYRAFLEDYKAQTKRYMDAHPNERAFVNPNMYTEVLYLSSGRLVGETESDNGRTVRSIIELLSGEEKAIRNPLNLKLLTLKWMIQEGMIDNAKSRVLKINKNSDDEVWHTPIDAPSNKGAVFAMIPGCNGHYLPLYINPVTYDELNEGTLKDLITKELLKLASPDLDTRRLAINKLLKILVLNENKNIWVGDEKHPSTLSIKNGVIETKFNLDSSDTHVEDIIKAIEDTGFRVNITQSVLQDNSMIKLYAEAGALSTDIAVLGAANASYTVYLVGKDGKPIKSNVVNNNVLGVSALKILEKREEKSGLSVRYGTNNLLYRKRGDSWYTVDEGSRAEKRIEDPRLKQQLELKSYIDKNGLTPSVSKGKFDYYIIDSNTEHPRVLMMNKETKGIVDMDASSAIRIIEESKLDATLEAKNKAAKLAVDNMGEEKLAGEMEDAELDLGELEISDEELANLMAGQWGDGIELTGEMLDIEFDLGEENLPPPPNPYEGRFPTPPPIPKLLASNLKQLPQQTQSQSPISSFDLDIRGSLGLSRPNIGPGYTAHFGPRTNLTGIGSGDPRIVARNKRLPKNKPTFIGKTMYIPEMYGTEQYHLLKGTGRDDWESVTFPRELTLAEQQAAIDWVMLYGTKISTWEGFAAGLTLAIEKAHITPTVTTEAPIQTPKTNQKSDGGINSSKINKTATELGSHNVASIMSKRDTSRRLVLILESKGMSKLDARNLDKVIEWLEGKSFDGKPIPVDNISDVDNWLHMIEECR